MPCVTVNGATYEFDEGARFYPQFSGRQLDS